jgi:hypothetical protein
MSLSSLLDEYDLSLDDIRWYLSSRIAGSLLMDRDEPERITLRIWSGALEGELYNLEERFLEKTRDELARGITDVQAVRDQLEEARLLKIRRPR